MFLKPLLIMGPHAEKINCIMISCEKACMTYLTFILRNQHTGSALVVRLHFEDPRGLMRGSLTRIDVYEYDSITL